MKTTDHASGIRLPDCSKLVLNWKKLLWRHHLSNWLHHWYFLTLWYFFVNFRYWFTFHVHIINGPGIIIIFVYNGLIRNRKIGNTPIWILSNIWRLGQFRENKFGKNISNKKLFHALKFEFFSFYLSFWVIKVRSTEGEGGL